MAMAESEERRVLTILWKIENIELMERIYFCGFLVPMLKVRTLEDNMFQFTLWPKGKSGNHKNINLQLAMYNKDPLDFPIDCEWSIIGINGSPLVSGTMRNHVFNRLHPLIMSGCPTHEEVFVTRRSAFLSDDTLTLQFRIWKSHGNFPTDEFISCRSKLEAMDHSFLWTIPRFSALQLNQKVTTYARFGNCFGSDNFMLKFSLSGKTRADASVSVELTPCSIPDLCLVALEVSALDNKQKVIESTKLERELFLRDHNETCRLPELVSRKELLRKKHYCLKKDILTLRCEMSIFWLIGLIDKYYHGVSNFESRGTKDFSTHKTPGFSTHSKEDFTALLDVNCQTSEQSVEQPDISLQKKDTLIFLRENLLSLYREQSMTDFELHSGDVSFPVHKIILSARSPVFKAMFSSCMKESDSNSQDVPDLDVHTLSRMLTFLYGGTVEPDLHLENAVKLYYAADKYQVESLKQQCSSIIQSGILVANVSDILTLADRHQDEQLRLFVNDFFLENFDEIIKSEEWETFQQREPALAGNAMIQVYKKKCDKKHP